MCQLGRHQRIGEDPGGLLQPKLTWSDTDLWALRCEISNWRWSGVPFYLRTGKRLAGRASEIVITFKRPPHNIFEDGPRSSEVMEPNRLVIRLQPNEGLKLSMTSKEPGPGGMRLFPASLNLSFNETFKTRLPEAYERLLMDVARGNQTLFMRSDEVKPPTLIDVHEGVANLKNTPLVLGVLSPF